MAIQSSGPIYLSNIQTEFGGSNPIYINEYYGVDTVPASGPITLADFYGTANLESFSGTFLAADYENLDFEVYHELVATNVYNTSFSSIVGSDRDYSQQNQAAGTLGNRSLEFILWNPTIAAQFSRNGRTPNSSQIRLNSFNIVSYLKKYASRNTNGYFASYDGGVRMTPCIWNGSALVKAPSAGTPTSGSDHCLESPQVTGWGVRNYTQTADSTSINHFTRFSDWSDDDKANWVANGCPMHMIRDLKVSGSNYYYGALAGIQWTIDAEELT